MGNKKVTSRRLDKDNPSIIQACAVIDTLSRSHGHPSHMPKGSGQDMIKLLFLNTKLCLKPCISANVSTYWFTCSMYCSHIFEHSLRAIKERSLCLLQWAEHVLTGFWGICYVGGGMFQHPYMHQYSSEDIQLLGLRWLKLQRDEHSTACNRTYHAFSPVCFSWELLSCMWLCQA